MSKLVHIADRVLNRPLMIMPEKLALIAQVLDGRIGIDATGLAEFEAEHLKNAPDASRFIGQYEQSDPNDPKTRKPYRTTDKGIAVIPVIGSLVNRGGWVGAFSGMTSYEGFKYQIGAAAADGAVSGIILDMDSPGGEAVGAFEAGDAVREAAKIKPVIAVVNGMAASAAYAIASAASRIVTTASGVSGSIGVVMLHADYSHALHERGVKPTLIHAGARKVDGNPYQPLTDEVKAELKAEIDRFYDLFVASVAANRGGRISEAAIRATEARTYIGADAVKVGLADAVGSFETALAELSKGSSAPRKPKNVKQSSGLSLEVPSPAPHAVTAPASVQGETRPGAELNLGPGPAISAPGAVPAFEEIVAKVTGAPAKLQPENVTESWDAALAALKGKSTLPLGAGWGDAIAKAAGKQPTSAEPGFGWLAVIAKVNGEERGREPLLHGWGDVLAKIDREQSGVGGAIAVADDLWAGIVERVNSGELR